MDAYLGVDISAGRWAGVLLGERRDFCIVADDIASLVEQARTHEPLAAIAIDVPIGPPITGVRACDTAARAALPGRGSTLFTTPSLAALEVARSHGFAAAGYGEASAVNLEAQGIRLTKQSYGLAAKIVDVHDWLAAGGADGTPVVECHPELSFAHLANPRAPSPQPFAKKTWEGMRRRIKMLHGAGIDVQYLRDETGLIGADDLVDAAVCAWTARRYAAGNAVRFPASGTVASEPAIWA